MNNAVYFKEVRLIPHPAIIRAANLIIVCLLFLFNQTTTGAFAQPAPPAPSYSSGAHHLKPGNLTTGVSVTAAQGEIVVPLMVVAVSAAPRDFNPYVPYVGQQVVGRSVQPIVLSDGRVMPTGTAFFGQIIKVVPARRMQLDGYGVIRFDLVRSPNGMEFPISSLTEPKHGGKTRTYARLASIGGHALAGASSGLTAGTAVGLVALCFNPNNGLVDLAVCAGAGMAIGAVAGAGYAMVRKGDDPTSVLDRHVNITIEREVAERAAVPWSLEEESEAPVRFSFVKARGLTNPYRVEIEAEIVNDSDEAIDSADLYLENPHGHRVTSESDPIHNHPSLFDVPPHTSHHFWTTFTLAIPQSGCKLIWYKHGSFTEPLVQFELP